MAEQNVNIPWEGWKCVKPIGKGGFGAVYEIERIQHGIKEKAAMKKISIPQSEDEIDTLRIEGYDDESITQRFSKFAEDIIREYGMMVQMKGTANIVYCDDYKMIQQDDGFGWDIYIKMELLTPLMKALNQVYTEEQIIRFGIDLCNALEVCQKRNVIHRDIKPQNIFVSDDSVFKLGDFGIARTAEKTTRATVGIGTYQFMAPEVNNDKPYGATVDIYSLGMVMYWLLNSRRTPFLPLPPAVPKHSEEEQARQRRFAGEKIPAPRDGSEALKKIVLKACAFDPRERYQTARQMREDLLHLAGQSVPMFPPAPVPDPEPVPFTDLDDTGTAGPNFGQSTDNDISEIDDSSGQEFIDPPTDGPRFKPKSTPKTAPKVGANVSEKKKPWFAVATCAVVLIMVGLIFGWWQSNNQKNVGTEPPVFPLEPESFYNTYWQTPFDEETGSMFIYRFFSNGTYDKSSLGATMVETGTYSLSKGVLTIGNEYFHYDGESTFVSRETYGENKFGPIHKGLYLSDRSSWLWTLLNADDPSVMNGTEADYPGLALITHSLSDGKYYTSQAVLNNGVTATPYANFMWLDLSDLRNLYGNAILYSRREACLRISDNCTFGYEAKTGSKTYREDVSSIYDLAWEDSGYTHDEICITISEGRITDILCTFSS